MTASTSQLAQNSPENPADCYTLHGQIGSGGMATVHLGRLAGAGQFARTVAIKRMRPEIANNQRFVDMFLAEARVSARVRHPNVVSTLDVVATKGELWLVMDYIHGECLARLARDRSRGEALPVNIACGIVGQVLQGLEAVHNAKNERRVPLNIVHRDVSPQNVLVGADGIARLLDFGAAKTAVTKDIADEGVLIGKLAYMSPEQIRGRRVDRRTDVFAAGVVLWEALTGQYLFGTSGAKATAQRVLAGHIPSVAAMRSDVPRALDRVLAKAMAPSPSKRYASANEFAEALEDTVQLAGIAQISSFVQERAGEALSARSQRLVAVETRRSEIAPGTRRAGWRFPPPN